MRNELARIIEERNALLLERKYLRELVACTNEDGGQYHAEHGAEMAVKLCKDNYYAAAAEREALQAKLSAAARECESLRFMMHELGEVQKVDRAEIARLEKELLASARERDQYKRAKERNDERFMCERDEARSERDRYLAALKAEVIATTETAMGMSEAEETEMLWPVELGGITFLVTRKPDGSLEAEEVK
jgi:hypothetical protein